MGRVKVRRQLAKHIYPHNDLMQAAHHFKTRVDDRLAANDLRGISYDILAELVFLAFAVEAQVNFLGNKLIAGWNEWDRFNDKFKSVAKRVGVVIDWNSRPYSTVKVLKKDLRDILAHGKPIYRQTDKEVIIDHDDPDDENPFADLEGDWFNHCKGNFYRDAYEDVRELWDAFVKAAKLVHFDTMTRGERSVTFIAHVPDPKPEEA